MTTSLVPQNSVRAGVSERKLFAALPNWFASSFSVLGELMQNARRAEAHAVHFELEGKDLTVQDDGIGVDNFQALVQFADSGWKLETQIAESPFGMGFFSCLYCAEAVTVQSRGKRLKVTLADVLDRRELEVMEDASVTTGTLITLHQLKDSFLAEEMVYTHPKVVKQPVVKRELMFRASGFPIVVTFNGEMLPRPHAQEKLNGELTEVGFVSIFGVHRGEIGKTVNETAYFLQGLPIRYSSFGRDLSIASNVVHLDQHKFTALLPDRAHLKDEGSTVHRVSRAIFDATHRFMLQEKQLWAPEVFLARWMHSILGTEHAVLLNDIPLLPGAQLSRVQGVTNESDECWKSSAHSGKFLTPEDIVAGRVRIWNHAPSHAADSPIAAALLKVMQMEEIHAIDSGLHSGHWIYSVIPSTRDLVVTVTPGEEVGRSLMPDVGHTNKCELIVVRDFVVAVTSSTDPDFGLTRKVSNNWIILPAPGSDWDVDDLDVSQDNVCYLTMVDQSPDHPVDVFHTYIDSNDRFDEQFQTEARVRFEGLARGLKSLPLSNTVQDAINALNPSVAEQQVGMLTLVCSFKRWNSYAGCVSRPNLKAFDLDNHLFESIAKVLGDGTTAQRLQQAFTTVLKPGALQPVEDEAKEMLLAARYSPRKGAGDSWYALLPGHTAADFEAEDHNYLGLFSSLEEMLAEVVPEIMARTAAHHCLTDEVLAGMEFTNRYKLVQEAHPLPAV